MFYVPNIFKIKPYVITSGSMEPRYPVGSIIYVKKIDYKKIDIGDSITFYLKNSKIVATHEVYDVDLKNRLFRTQGINNLDDQKNIIHDAEPVSFDNVIGKPILCVPYIGYINKLIAGFPGMYIVIGITLLIICISFIFDKLNKKNMEVNYEK